MIIFTWQPDPHSMDAHYIQIASHIKTLIKKGYLKGGDKLSERNIAAQMGVNRTTVTRAFNLLREYGFFESSERSSTRVAKNIDSIVQSNINWQKIVSRSNIQESPSYLKQILYKNANTHLNLGLVTFNNEEFKTLDFFKEIVSSVTPKDIEEMFYEQSAQGLLALRREITEFMKRYNIDSFSDNITVFSGYQEALHCIVQTILTPNTVIFYSTDGVSQYFAPLSLKNIQRCRVNADADGMIPDDLIVQIKRHSGRNRVLLLEDNTYMPCKRQNMIRQICVKEQITLIELCIFRDLHNSPYSVPDSRQTIYIGAPSLTMEVGARFAWVITPDEFTLSLVDSKFQMYGGNSSWEIFCWKMLQNGKYNRYLDKIIDVVVKRNQIISAAFDKYLAEFVEWHRQSAMMMLIKFKKNISFDRGLLNKYECLSITQMMNISGICVDTVSVTAAKIVEMFKDISENYIIA